MRVALVDERHHVVVGVDVEPDAAVAEPVGSRIPSTRCRSDCSWIAPVRQFTWPSLRGCADGPGRSPGARAATSRDAGSRYGSSWTRGPPGRRAQAALALLPRDAERVEVRAGVGERARRGAARRRCGRGPARRRPARAQYGSSSQASRPGRRARRARTGGPARRRLVEVGDAQATWSIRRSAITRHPHRQALDAVEEVRAQPLRRAGELDRLRRAEQLLERDPDLHLGECAPMQWWMPPGPNAMCWFGVRPTSNASGLLEDRLVAVAGHEPGRDLVARLDRRRRPARCLRRRAAEVVHRRAQRSISSAARLDSVGSPRSRSSCSGCSSRQQPCVIVCRVVSLPAVASSTK